MPERLARFGKDADGGVFRAKELARSMATVLTKVKRVAFLTELLPELNEVGERA
jgi:hypothetical protein